jgi:hypothetical protein
MAAPSKPNPWDRERMRAYEAWLNKSDARVRQQQAVVYGDGRDGRIKKHVRRGVLREQIDGFAPDYRPTE